MVKSALRTNYTIVRTVNASAVITACLRGAVARARNVTTKEMARRKKKDTVVVLPGQLPLPHMEQYMSFESARPEVYWQVGDDGDKHEIPEGAKIYIWDDPSQKYLVLYPHPAKNSGSVSKKKK